MKLNVIDRYKCGNLYERLGCGVDPMTAFLSVEGEIVRKQEQCDRNTVIQQLNRIVTDPVDVTV